MRLFRFHLSTLLLLCVCAGAIMGVYLDRALWRVERSTVVESNVGPWAIDIGRDYPWIYKSTAILGDDKVGTELAPEVHEMTFFVDRSRRIDTFVQYSSGGYRHAGTFATEADIHWVKYAPDFQHLAVGMNNRIAIYRRTHGYGIFGYIKLPLFWIALVSGAGLCALFVRWAVSNARRLRKEAVVKDDK